MLNDLIVIAFDNEADAEKVWGALKVIRNRKSLGVLNSVIVTRDRAGKVIVQLQRQLPVDQTDPGSQMPGLLANLLFGTPTDEGPQKLVDAGLDERFVKMMASTLNPDSSMIINYIRQDSLVDTQQVLETLNQFNGTLHHTTVPAEVEETIVEGAGHE
jgi:uncharacterized membrane protein